jgi:hypothetical protein
MRDTEASNSLSIQTPTRTRRWFLATPIEKIPVHTHGDRIIATGYYGERLGRQLLHLDLPPWDDWLTHHADRHFDFVDEDGVRAQIETKMFNNKDRLIIYADQLTSQLDEPSFPVEDKVIMMIDYNNQGPCERRVHQKTGKTFTYSPRLLPQLLAKQRNRNWETFSRFFASKIYRVTLLDIRILEYWVKKHGTRPFTRDGKDNPDRKFRPIVPIGRTDIDRLVAHTREGLRRLDVADEEMSLWLPPGAHKTVSRRIDMVLDGNDLSFTLNVLLPNGTKKRFLRRMNGSVTKPPDTRHFASPYA